METLPKPTVPSNFSVRPYSKVRRGIATSVANTVGSLLHDSDSGPGSRLDPEAPLVGPFAWNDYIAF